MLSSIGGLSRKAVAQRKGRSALTAAGVALGVALFFGALISNASGIAAMDRSIRTSAGAADVVITPVGDTRQAVLDGRIEPTVKRLPDVDAVLGVVGAPTTIATASGRGLGLKYNHPDPAILLGADADQANRFYPYRFASGRSAVAGRDEVVLPKRLADGLGLRAGERIVVSTPLGNRRVVVVGLLADAGAGQFNQGRVVLTSLATARRMVGRGGAVTQVFIDLHDGIDAKRWIKTYGSKIGSGVTIDPASNVGRADVARRQLVAAGSLLNVLGATVLFVAGFLIYLTLSTAVVERVRLYGTLRALGARRSQIRTLVVREALILGVAATAGGLLIGLGVAAGLIDVSRRLLENVGIGSPSIVVTPVAVVAATTLGLVTTLASAMLPARRASRLDPVEAIRGDYATDVRLSRMWIVGAVCFAAAALLLLVGRNVAEIGLATPLFLFGAVTMVPLLLRPLARVTGALTARFARGIGDVAVLHLAKERTRSGYTLALVMVVMAAAIAIRATNTSYTSSLDRQIASEFGADLMVSSASTFPSSSVAEIQRTPGVAVVAPMAIARARILLSGGRSELGQARFIDPQRQFDAGEDFLWRDGDAAVARPALEAGGSLIFPFTTAERLGLHRGDLVTLATSQGPKRFRIAATAEISNSLPTMYFDWTVGRRLFGVSNPSFLFVSTKKGTDVASVRSTIEHGVGSRTTLVVSTIDDVKADVHAQIGGGLNSFLVLLFLAGLLGLFGLTNTMAVSMLQRYREIGLLRAIGARKRQVRAMALVESSTLVAVALVLAIPIGSFLSYPLVAFAARLVGDITVHYVFPWKLLPVLAALGAFAAVVTAIGPARQATKLDIETALRFE